MTIVRDDDNDGDDDKVGRDGRDESLTKVRINDCRFISKEGMRLKEAMKVRNRKTIRAIFKAREEREAEKMKLSHDSCGDDDDAKNTTRAATTAAVETRRNAAAKACSDVNSFLCPVY